MMSRSVCAAICRTLLVAALSPGGTAAAHADVGISDETAARADAPMSATATAGLLSHMKALSDSEMAEARGWQVSRIKIDDGCYQIRGIDETGQAFKAKIDPATLSIVKMKRKDRHEDDDGPRERRQSSGPGTSGASGTLPANKSFETGKPPESVVK